MFSVSSMIPLTGPSSNPVSMYNTMLGTRIRSPTKSSPEAQMIIVPKE